MWLVPKPKDELPSEDDDFSDLSDEDYPSQLGQKWTPAMNNVMAQMVERLEERERQRGDGNSEE
jgi:hypothetical protein